MQGGDLSAYTEYRRPAQRTFIIGGTYAEARRWCQDNGVQPFAHTTKIVTTPLSVRGMTIRPEDRVVWYDGPIDERLIENVRIAQMSGDRR